MEDSIEKFLSGADWIAVLPEAILACFGVILILLGAFKKIQPKFCCVLAFVGFIASICAVVSSPNEYAFFQMLAPSPFSSAFFIMCGVLTASMSQKFLNSLSQKNAGEFFGILTIAVAALSIFARSRHLMLTFVALETSAICFYALIAWGRRNIENLEASIKYIIVSGVSGAFFLLGIAFVYASSFELGSEMLYYGNFTEGGGNVLFGVGAVLAAAVNGSPLQIMAFLFFVVGLFFKISLVPFHQWTPDVYQGAPAPVAAFLAVASKSAAVIALFSMLISMPFSDNLVTILSVSAAMGIIIGNFGGLNEKNAKRIVAFSGIANAGYLMVFLTAAVVLTNISDENSDAIGYTLVLYVLSYAFAVYAIFFVQSLYKSANDADLCVCAYKGLWGKNPTAATSLTLGLASLAGIPPTAGFFAKLFVLVLAYAAGLYWLMLVLVLGSAASIYYYFKWIRAAFEPLQGSEECQFVKGHSAVLIALCMAILVLGVRFAFLLTANA